MSRAKYGVFLFGNKDVLQKDIGFWNDLLERLRSSGRIFNKMITRELFKNFGRNNKHAMELVWRKMFVNLFFDVESLLDDLNVPDSILGIDNNAIMSNNRNNLNKRNYNNFSSKSNKSYDNNNYKTKAPQNNSYWEKPSYNNTQNPPTNHIYRQKILENSKYRYKSSYENNYKTKQTESSKFPKKYKKPIIKEKNPEEHQEQKNNHFYYNSNKRPIAYQKYTTSKYKNKF